MNTWFRRTLYYVLMLAVAMFVYAILYNLGMNVFEGEPQNFLHSLQVVVETFTTTGFGSDAPWQSPVMNLFVIAMILTGVLLIFTALPVLVFPLFEEALSTTVPTALEQELENHVVICTHTPRADALIAELDSWDVPYVIVEPDREAATELYEDDYNVIHEEPNAVSGLKGARLSQARALVADVTDRIDTSIVLTAKEVSESVPIVSVVEEPDRATYHRLAGADDVLSPRPLLGESLASKVTTAVRTDLGDTVEIGDDLEVAELPIRRGSPLEGKTLAESHIREQTGVNVVGAWFQGDFESPPSPEATLDRGSVLLVTGRADQLAELRDLTLSEVRHFNGGEVMLVGYGQVGERIAAVFDEEGIDYTTVDRDDHEGVDIVGDATDPETLREAGIESARSVILAIPDDTTTEFATLVIRDLSPETEVLARAEEGESIQKMYRAGADYVLSLGTVTGRMIASTILEDEEVISMDTQVDVIRTTAPRLEGQTLADADVRSRTGCTVVGVERGGDVLTELGPTFRIQAGDELIIAGTDDGTNQFMDTFR